MFRRYASCLIGLLSVLATVTLTRGQPLSSTNEFLDSAKKVSLTWSHDADTITFEISAPTKGYVGLGISTNGTMFDADIVVGWVIDGKAVLSDRYSTGYMEPVIDEQQDYLLLSGTLNDTSTTLRFSRKLVTGDPKDMIIKPGIMNLIYAFHDEVPTDGHSIHYHGDVNRGAKPTTLIN